MNISIKILISILLLVSCTAKKPAMYENPIDVVKVETDTVYLTKTDWEKVKKLKKENHLLRVEIDHLKKKMKLMEILIEINENR